MAAAAADLQHKPRLSAISLAQTTQQQTHTGGGPQHHKCEHVPPPGRHCWPYPRTHACLLCMLLGYGLGQHVSSSHTPLTARVAALAGYLGGWGAGATRMITNTTMPNSHNDPNQLVAPETAFRFFTHRKTAYRARPTTDPQLLRTEDSNTFSNGPLRDG